ncbi:6-phosphofructo-2-kinase 2 [Diutina catenulata]
MTIEHTRPHPPSASSSASSMSNCDSAVSMYSLYRADSSVVEEVALDVSDINSKLMKEREIHDRLNNKIERMRYHQDSAYTSEDSEGSSDDATLDGDRAPGSPEHIVVMLVGLPASGKSTICKQLNRFFNKHQCRSGIYNAGDVRRKLREFESSDFFDPNNERGQREREHYADITIANLISDLNSNAISIGFLDATNTTKCRRKRMMQKLVEEVPNPTIVVMDIQCNEPDMVNFNIACKTKNADYAQRDYTDAITDFKVRAQHYMEMYEPITSRELINYPLNMYINYQNGGEVFDLNRFDGVCPRFMELITRFRDGYHDKYGREYLKRVTSFHSFIKNLA